MELQYMITWVKLHAKTSIANWSQDEICAAFLMLPKPEISFAEWLALLNGEMPEQAVKEDPLEKLERSELINLGMVTIEDVVQVA